MAKTKINRTLTIKDFSKKYKAVKKEDIYSLLSTYACDAIYYFIEEVEKCENITTITADHSMIIGDPVGEDWLLNDLMVPALDKFDDFISKHDCELH